jgi:rubredoxin
LQLGKIRVYIQTKPEDKQVFYGEIPHDINLDITCPDCEGAETLFNFLTK